MAVLGRKGSSRGDVVDMGVVLEGAPPGVEHAEEAWEISSHIFFIQGEFLHGLGGCLEKSRVGHALMASNEAAQGFGNGEGDHEVVAGKLSPDLGLQPLPGFQMLAGGAMAVAARLIYDVEVSALLALEAGDSCFFGAAGSDRIDGLSVLPVHVVPEAFKVLGTEGGEDLIDCRHDRDPPSPD